MHLIAISGLHMGIVFFLAYLISLAALRVLAALTGRSFDSPLLAKISGLSCVVAYSLFVGYSPPTVRAAIMVAVLVMSLILKRKANLLESLSVAGIIILLWMPWSLCSVSFLLSFSAVLGITGLCQRWKSLPGWLKAVAVPIVSMAFTCPVAAYFFGFVSPVTIPANIIIVPLFSFIVMPLGFSGLALSQISEQLSSMAFSLAFMGIRLILSWAKSYGSLEPVSIFGLPWVLVSCFGLITAFFARSSRLVTVILTTCVIFIIAMPVCLRIISSSQGLSFDIISVGQGDSVLVTKNSCALLIDGGPAFSVSDAGRSIVAPYLIGNGVSQIDLAVITHAHPDHSGGMPFILEHFPVKNIITTSETTTNPSFMNVIRIAERKSIPVKCVSRGDVLHLAGTRIEVLNPPCRTGKFSEDLDQNLQSLVIRIVDDTMKGLFMADAAGLGEIRLSRLDQDITADVLKVAHHGTRNSCMDMFLDKVKTSCCGDLRRTRQSLPSSKQACHQASEKAQDLYVPYGYPRQHKYQTGEGVPKFKLGKTRTDKGFK
jgi:competence protein ComEC